jgi:hypothetical protein
MGLPISPHAQIWKRAIRVFYYPVTSFGFVRQYRAKGLKTPCSKVTAQYPENWTVLSSRLTGQAKVDIQLIRITEALTVTGS